MKTKIIVAIFLLNIFLPKMINSQWEYMKSYDRNHFIYSFDYDQNAIIISLGNMIYLTTDKGISWQIMNNSQFFYFVTDLKLFNNKIYALDRMHNYIFTKKINEEKWEKLNNIINPKKIYKINDEVIIISSLGIYKMEEKNWIKFIDQIPYESNINCYFEDEKRIYLGYTVSKDSIIKGLFPKQNFNIAILNKESQKLDTVKDSDSDIWKQHINCIDRVNDTLFACTSNGIYFSTNQGLNWKLLSEFLKYKDSLYKFEYSTFKISQQDGIFYTICSTDTNAYETQYSYRYHTRFYCYSLDRGKTWVYTDKYEHLHTTDYLHLKDSIIFGNPFGLYLTDNKLNKFRFLTNPLIPLKGVQTTCLNYKNDTLFASHSGDHTAGGFNISTDKGQTWKNFYYNELTNYPIRKFWKNKNIFFAITAGGVFYMSKDYGKTFARMSSSQGLNNFNIKTVKFINDTIYVGTMAGLYISDDWGNTWKNITSPINMVVWDLELVDSLIFIGSDRGKFYISTDRGINWTSSTLPSSKKNLYFLNVISLLNYKGKMYFGTELSDNNIFTPPGEGLYYSYPPYSQIVKHKDYLTDSLDIIELLSIDNHLIMLSNRGVFYFTNGEIKSKEIKKNGLFSRTIFDLERGGNYLFAATEDGVYRLPLIELGIVSVDDSHINKKQDYLWASIAYPNPAKDYVQAKVWWDTHNDIEKAEIAVYDIYGNLLAGRERIEIIPENDYSGIIRWECGDVPSGVYILTIQHGTRKQAVRLVKE